MRDGSISWATSIPTASWVDGDLVEPGRVDRILKNQEATWVASWLSIETRPAGRDGPQR